MLQLALYPGSFDPVTYGHIDLIKRASKIFDQVIVAVAHNTQKQPLFSIEKRVNMLREATKDIKCVKIDDFNGLVVDYAKKNNIQVVLRGLRMVSDFEHEFQMALTNRKFNEKIETVFMMPSESYAYLSSGLIKEAVSLGASVDCFVPDFVEEALKSKLKIKTKK